MNILLVSYLFYPEPIVMSTIVEDLACYLSEKHSVTVLTSPPCRPYGFKLPQQTEKTDWPFKRIILDSKINPKSEFIGRLRENFSFGAAASSYIKGHHSEIDVIYMDVFPLFSMKKIIATANQYNIATVNHIEDIYPEPFKHKVPIFGRLVFKMLLPIDKWIIKNATTSIVIGKKIKDFFISTRNATPKDVEVVYNWQDENRYRIVDEQSVVTGPFTFMYVGSISDAANLHHILDCFVKAELSNCQLVFAGSGSEKRSLMNEAQMKRASNVKFIDVNPANIGSVQGSADVLILPLRPTIALRAVPSKSAAYLFSKKPVLASVDVDSDAADIVNEAKCGWVVAPDDSVSLIERMREIANINKDVLNEMGRRGYDYSQMYLTKEVNLKKLADTVIISYYKKNEHTYV